MQEFDLIVIGGGPGGYLCAERAGKAGLRTALIEKRALGGTCLNEGCIPTKSLCRNAEVLEDLRRAEEFGIGNASWTFDFAKAVECKNAVIDQLKGGVEFLLKNKLIRLVYGKADFKDAKTVIVKPADGGKAEEIKSDYIIMATGPVSCFLYTFDAADEEEGVDMVGSLS